MGLLLIYRIRSRRSTPADLTQGMASIVLIVALIAPHGSISRPERGEDLTDMLSALYVAYFAGFIFAILPHILG